MLKERKSYISVLFPDIDYMSNELLKIQLCRIQGCILGYEGLTSFLLVPRQR